MNDKDELSIHLHKIAQYSCSYEVHISDIENGTAPAPFLNLFNNMLSRNNALINTLSQISVGGNLIVSMICNIKEFRGRKGKLVICNYPNPVHGMLKPYEARVYEYKE